MLRVKIKMTPNRPSQVLDKFEKWFPGRLQATHMGAVLNILECNVMWSRVDTGRFRGGWMGLAQETGYPIQRSLASGSGNFDAGAQEEGIAVSTVINNPLSTYVENGVVYGEPLEENVGIFDQDGVSSFAFSPYRGIEDAQAFYQEKYSGLMNKVMDTMSAEIEKGEYPEEPYIDFGQPGPQGETL